MLSKRILVLMFLLVFLLSVGCFPSPAPPIAENQAPIITSTPVSTATVGEIYYYNVEATDPDGDTLTYSLIAAKPAGMIINLVGLISWVPAAEGVYDVTVIVSDGTLNVTQSFTIEVEDPCVPPCPPDPCVPPCPSVNHAPIITSTPSLNTIVGVKYTYIIKATDPEGDTITYSLVSWPTGMTFDGIATISWTPTKGQVGVYGVTVKASDGKKDTTQNFTITVSAVELTSIVVDPKTMDLIVRGTESIKSVTAHYSDGSTFVIDQQGYDYGSGSSDETIATVSNAGVVTAVEKGTTTITVGYVDKTDTIEVTVNPIRLTSIVVLPETMTLFVGEFEAIKSVTAHYNDGTKAEIKFDDCIYESSDTSVASVDTSGTVTAEDDGEATITISYTEGEITKTIYIEETDTVEVKVIRKVHNITIDRYYDTIRGAIFEAWAGDTIEVAAGTYEENVNIDESVTLQGEDRETTEIIFGYGTYPSEPPLTISADGVVVSGFTIRSGPHIEAGLGALSGYAHTIIVDGDSALFTDLNVIKEPFNLPRISGSAFLLTPGLNGFTFTDSTVDSAWNGIYAREDSSNIVIRNVDFTYPGGWGIMLKMITGATIEDNTFTCTDNQIGVLVTLGSDSIEIVDNEFIGSGSLVASHIGVLLQAYATGTMGDVDILRNDISGFNTGILVEDVATLGISIHDNNIYNNLSYGLNYLGLYTVNAENNWWGHISGPSGVGPGTGNAVSANVDYDPWSDSIH